MANDLMNGGAGAGAGAAGTSGAGGADGAAGTQGGQGLGSQQYGGSQGGQQYGGQSQYGQQGQNPWEADPRFRGKQPADIWKSYSELEKKLGGLPDLEKRVGEWERFGNAWKPYLERLGWDPNRLASIVEAAARGNQGAQQQLRDATQGAQGQQSQSSWLDAMTPESQEKWITQRVDQARAEGRQEMQQVAQTLVDYFNRFGDLALRAVEQKFAQLPENVRPKLAINDLLQEAVNIATNRYDPLEWAARIRTAEPQDAVEARIRADERAKVLAENKNSAMTTFAGSSGGAARTLRPRNSVAPQGPSGAMNGQGVPRVPESAAIASARDRFAGKWDQISQG